MRMGNGKVLASRSRFFLTLSVLLLLTLLAGFAPTLYLRTAFDAIDMPLYLHVHGAVISTWFVVFVLQNALIAGQRPDLHRRLGMAAAFIAIGIVFAGPMATFGFVPRLPGMGLDVEMDIIFVSWVIIGNLSSILAFAVFVGCGLYYRSKSDVHKRLMLLASVVIIGPALARMAFWPMFSWTTEIPFVVTGTMIYVMALPIYDAVRNSGHLPRVTIIGTTFAAWMTLSPYLLAQVPLLQNLVKSLA